MHQKTLNRLIMPVFIILVSYPVSVYAAEVAQNAGFDLGGWGMWTLFAASNIGGIAATRIRTRLDENLYTATFSKWFIGAGFSFFACIGWNAFNPAMTAGHLVVFAFVLGLMGANIMVFIAAYWARKETQDKAGRFVDRKLGIDENQPQTPNASD